MTAFLNSKSPSTWSYYININLEPLLVSAAEPHVPTTTGDTDEGEVDDAAVRPSLSSVCTFHLCVTSSNMGQPDLTSTFCSKTVQRVTRS